MAALLIINNREESIIVSSIRQPFCTRSQTPVQVYCNALGVCYETRNRQFIDLSSVKKRVLHPLPWERSAAMGGITMAKEKFAATHSEGSTLKL